MINEILADDLKVLMQNPESLLLIDVRRSEERRAFHIGGVHLPFEDFDYNLELPHNKTIVFYCAKGVRSGIILQRLQIKDNQKVMHLKGGLSTWVP